MVMKTWLSLPWSEHSAKPNHNTKSLVQASLLALQIKTPKTYEEILFLIGETLDKLVLSLDGPGI